MLNADLFAHLQWSVECLKRLETLPSDCRELDLKIDLLNLVRDVAIILNNPSEDAWQITVDAEDIAERMLGIEEEYLWALLERIRESQASLLMLLNWKAIQNLLTFLSKKNIHHLILQLIVYLFMVLSEKMEQNACCIPLLSLTSSVFFFLFGAGLTGHSICARCGKSLTNNFLSSTSVWRIATLSFQSLLVSLSVSVSIPASRAISNTYSLSFLFFLIL